MTHQYLAIQYDSYVIHIEHIQQSFHLAIADSIRPFGIRRLQFYSVSISLVSSDPELRSTRQSLEDMNPSSSRDVFFFASI